jgi:uncharacterized membrane protein
MNKGRLEAFSDGVLAIIITIMVLEMEAPEGTSFRDLLSVLPTFIGYILSYTYVAVYWVNHHRILKDVKFINDRVLWTNILWMFSVSLIPFATAWISSSHFAAVPMFLYSLILLISAFFFHILLASILTAEGHQTTTMKVIAQNKRSVLTILFYAISTVTALFWPIVSFIILAAVTPLWYFKESTEQK